MARITILVITACIAVSLCVAKDEVCYEPLGCFSMDSPWTSLLRPLPAPESPEKIKTRFILYTRDDPRPFNVSLHPKINLENSKYKSGRLNVFVTHGFTGNGDLPWMAEIKDAMLAKVDANIFLTDWGPGAAGVLNYLQVAANTRVVAAELARLIDFLVREHGAKAEDFHLIGHSLGAQISGYAGKRVKGLAKITALDPAQPAFEGYDKDVRLDPTDANFVEVVHTDAKPFIPLLGLGMIGSFGDVDFFINGGLKQPGCLIPKNPPIITSLADLAKIPVEKIADFVACPHGRSVRVYIEALRVKNCTFWGHPGNILETVVEGASRGYLARYLVPSEEDCSLKSCSPLGLETERYPARGSFVVATTSREPYCIREPDVDVRMARELVSFVKKVGGQVFGGIGSGVLGVGSVVHKAGARIFG